MKKSSSDKIERRKIDPWNFSRMEKLLFEPGTTLP